ncbi:MAG: PIN domain-containing protein, partial [Dehalococcoidia bacterium]
MIVLDAYPVLALLKGELAAPDVRALIERDGATLTPLGIAEVLDYLVRLAGADAEQALLDLAQLGLDAPPAVDADVGARAGLLRARQYHRRDRALSLADCVAAETARALDVPLATADPHLLDTCTVEGIAVIPLPDSRGGVWS